MDKLQELLDTMQVPKFRREDFRWLQRNLGIRNGGHPQFGEAMLLIEGKIREEEPVGDYIYRNV